MVYYIILSMKNNTEGKRKDTSEKKKRILRILKTTGIVVLSVLILTALGILLWMKVIRVHKARLSEGLPKAEGIMHSSLHICIHQTQQAKYFPTILTLIHIQHR